MAASYCAWQDKRLPLSVEWQVAASVSPNTGRSFRYPWGEDFEPQRTNGASSKVGDTLVVGSYRPGGDSSSGASDMAGNVAEWTATLVVGPQNKSLVIVKGGSFASGDTALLVDAEMLVKAESALPDVGFRCARTYLISES
jgi:iron(II)-dependent oxidoreductase